MLLFGLPVMKLFQSINPIIAGRKSPNKAVTRTRILATDVSLALAILLPNMKPTIRAGIMPEMNHPRMGPICNGIRKLIIKLTTT